MDWSEYPRFNISQRRSVSLALKAFFDGKSLAFAAKMLLPIFDKELAKIVIATESTKMYAQREFVQAKKLRVEMQSTWPDIIIYKIWQTANDQYCCPFCAENNQKRIPIDELFGPKILIPPAHPGCRCGISTSTSLFDNNKK